MMKVWGFTAVAVVAFAAAATIWESRIALGVLAGGLWNLVSLWCLARLLNAWLGPHPSNPRVLAWLLVKFPLLYLLVWGLVRSPAVSLLGFGLGFSLVLVSIVGGFASHVRRMMPARSHGR